MQSFISKINLRNQCIYLGFIIRISDLCIVYPQDIGSPDIFLICSQFFHLSLLFLKEFFFFFLNFECNLMSSFSKQMFREFTLMWDFVKRRMIDDTDISEQPVSPMGTTGFFCLFTACSITDSNTTCLERSSYTFYIIYVSILLQAYSYGCLCLIWFS